MKKRKEQLLILCFATVFILGFSGEACSFEALDGKLRVHGFLRNETGVRLKTHVWYDSMIDNAPIALPRVENGRQDSGTLSTCRTTLQVETEYDLTRDLRLGVTLRSFYDAKWNLDSSLGTGFDDHANDMQGEPDGEKFEYDVDLREYFITWAVGNFFIKAGRQQIAWGEADALRIADIINPLDYTRDYSTTVYGLDWEDIRIPQRMIQIVYVVPESRYQYEIEVVLNPEDFRANVKGSPYAETWYAFPQQIGFSDIPFNELPFGGMGTSVSEWDAFTNVLLDAYDNAESSFSGGARLRGVFGGWDLHLFYFYQRWQDPIITAPHTFSLPFFPFDILRDDWGIKMRFPYVNTIGGTFNYFHNPSGAVFRGECGYVIDEPFTALNQGVGGPAFQPWDSWFRDEIIYKDTFHYMIGFDRPTWIHFLNKTNTFFISGQFYHKIIMSYDDEVGSDEDGKYLLSTMMGKDSRSDHQTLASLKINTKYYDDRIKPDVLAVWDINAQTGYVLPKVQWEPTYDWHFELGCIYFWSDNFLSGPFGYVSHNDLVYAMVEYKF